MATKVYGFHYDYEGESVADTAEDIGGCIEQDIWSLAEIMDRAGSMADGRAASAIADASLAIKRALETHEGAFEAVGRVIAAHPEQFANFSEAWGFPGIYEPVRHLMGETA